MTFAHPYFLLLLLALPFLAWWRKKRSRQAAFLYSSVQLVKGVSNISKSAAARVLPALRWLALILFILGLARPQITESETRISASGIDIVVAIDLSLSMQAEDFKLRGQQVNRLVIAQDVVKKFISKRPNDRIGLVAFAGRAYIAAPLTLDHDFLLTNVDRLSLDIIAEGGQTAIGSALSAAVNRLRDIPSKSKIVILMTDGQNNAGKIPPLVAADAAQVLKIKVYTIGIGTRGLAPYPKIVYGRKVYENRPADIDEETLKAMSAKTDGKYYRADNSDTLTSIYDEIDKLERTEAEVRNYVRVEEMFHWAVMPGLFVFLLEVILGHTIWRKLP